MFSIRLSWCIVLVHALALPVFVRAGTGTDFLVYSGTEFSIETAEHCEWPRGALELVNDRMRSWGFLVWSSGMPNDQMEFVMDVRNSEDVQHHVDLMKGIKSLKRQIVLVPGHLPLYPGHAAPILERDRFGVVFQIGCQRTVNEWYERLPEVCPGLRRFGNRELQGAPESQPPTLVISVSHPFVELEQLQIPTTIDVKAGIDAPFRADERNADLRERVEEFVARHKARQEAVKNRGPAPR